MKSALALLEQNPLDNAWTIQDLSLWPDRTKFFPKIGARGLSYLSISGHPSQTKRSMVVLDDSGGEVESLFFHLPPAPITIRETNSNVLPKLKKIFPNAKCQLEWRMDVTEKTFLGNEGTCRQLV